MPPISAAMVDALLRRRSRRLVPKLIVPPMGSHDSQSCTGQAPVLADRGVDIRRREKRGVTNHLQTAGTFQSILRGGGVETGTLENHKGAARETFLALSLWVTRSGGGRYLSNCRSCAPT